MSDLNTCVRLARDHHLTKRLFMALAVAAGLSGISAPAHAEFIVDINQVGSNVVATGSGTINLTGLTVYGTNTFGQEIWPSLAFVGLGTEQTAREYYGFSGPASFGPGGNTPASALTGDPFALNGSSALPIIAVSLNYVSGSALSDSATFDNETIASLGLTPGTYTYTWSADDIKVVVSDTTSPPIPTPEPLTVSIFGAGVAGIAALRRRRKLAKA